MKPPNCAAKEFFVIKERRPVTIATKILDAEYKKFNQKSFVMNLNYLKEKQKNSLLDYFRNTKTYLMEPSVNMQVQNIL